MDCIICGNWFSSVIHNGACPTCERAIKQLGLNMMPNRIKKLAQAEKAGRLMVLPCKVGDTVWTNFAMSDWYFKGKDKPYSARVVFVGLNDSDAIGRGLINVSYGKHNYMTQFSLSDIGKTVFLTREKAEAALKKEKEANNE